MARGSSGGGGGGGGGFESYEMLQSGGQVDNSGKYTVSRKYYVTKETDLITTPANISVAGKIMLPSALSYQKIGPSIWEKTIEFSAPLKSTDTGVVKNLSGGAGGAANQEGRLQMETSATLLEISQHPEKQDLKERWNGEIVNGKLVFGETYTEQGTGTSGGKPKPNPMFGVTHFYSPEATIRHSYSTDVLSAQIWKGVFCIVDTDKVPGQFPAFPDYTNKKGVVLKHHWQILMPQISIVGGRYEITNTYKLLPLMTDDAAAALNKRALS